MNTENVNIYKLIELSAENSFKLNHKIPNLVDVPSHIRRNNINARQIIDEHKWGTYGENASKPFKNVKLVDCSTEHLSAILGTQPQITSLTTMVIMAILMERKSLSK